MIKKYSLLVKLNQHIKQLRMDRNSKAINLAKPIQEIKTAISSIWYLKDHSSWTQTPYVFKITEHIN